MIFEVIILILDVAFTVLLTWFCVPVGLYYHYWAPLLIFVAGYMLALAVVWIFTTIAGHCYPLDKKYEKPSKFASFMLRQAITYIIFHSLTKVKVIAECPLPSERFLIVCNHVSRFDPMVITMKYGKKGIAFISKPSNFKIPIGGGHFMKACCYLPIEREDHLKSLEVMKEASRLISNNLASIGVFPEGTRGEMSQGLGEFHEGVFSIATRVNAPIVVASVKGTELISKNFPKRRTHVTLKIIKVLYPIDYQGKTVKEISESCKKLIQESL